MHPVDGTRNATGLASGHASVVHADALLKRWGANTVLDGASFDIGPGVTGLLGANGAGKTTLFGMLLGFHRADAGTLTVLGRDPWTAGPEVRMSVGYAAEHESLPPDVRAHDYVRTSPSCTASRGARRSPAPATRSTRWASARSGSGRSARCRRARSSG